MPYITLDYLTSLFLTLVYLGRIKDNSVIIIPFIDNIVDVIATTSLEHISPHLT